MLCSLPEGLVLPTNSLFRFGTHSHLGSFCEMFTCFTLLSKKILKVTIHNKTGVVQQNKNVRLKPPLSKSIMKNKLPNTHHTRELPIPKKKHSKFHPIIYLANNL